MVLVSAREVQQGLEELWAVGAVFEGGKQASYITNSWLQTASSGRFLYPIILLAL